MVSRGRLAAGNALFKRTQRLLGLIYQNPVKVLLNGVLQAARRSHACAHPRARAHAHDVNSAGAHLLVQAAHAAANGGGVPHTDVIREEELTESDEPDDSFSYEHGSEFSDSYDEDEYDDVRVWRDSFYLCVGVCVCILQWQSRPWFVRRVCNNAQDRDDERPAEHITHILTGTARNRRGVCASIGCVARRSWPW